jgi:hypothetical protein
MNGFLITPRPEKLNANEHAFSRPTQVLKSIVSNEKAGTVYLGCVCGIFYSRSLDENEPISPLVGGLGLQVLYLALS